LNLNQKQSKLEQILEQEVAQAYPANGIYHDPGSLSGAVLETDWGTCEDPIVGTFRKDGRTGRKPFGGLHTSLIAVCLLGVQSQQPE